MVRLPFCVLALLVASVLAGCDNASTPTSATGSAVTAITESYTGTLSRNGAITHPFVVGTPGNITATLVSLSPDNTVLIGMSLGAWNTQTETCQLIITNDAAPQGRVIIGTAQNAGAFCVRAYDVGKFTGPTDYEIQVTHF